MVVSFKRPALASKNINNSEWGHTSLISWSSESLQKDLGGGAAGALLILKFKKKKNWKLWGNIKKIEASDYIIFWNVIPPPFKLHV